MNVEVRITGFGAWNDFFSFVPEDNWGMHLPELAAISESEVESIVGEIGGGVGYMPGNDGAGGCAECNIEWLTGNLHIRWIDKMP